MAVITQSHNCGHTVPGVNTAIALAWRLSSFMLALLLSWRVNRAYERWWAGRQAFAGVGSAALGVAQMATLVVHDAALRVSTRSTAQEWGAQDWGAGSGRCM